MDIGTNLKKARIKASMTQRKLAEDTNFAPSYICDIEKGRRKPTLATVEVFASALNVDVSVLLQTKCCYERLTNINGSSDFLDSDRCSNCSLFNVSKSNYY